MEASRLHSDTPSALPAGTRLGEFELLSLLGVGGFGIVYLAFDHALEREVAVKEYMPASLAGRTETMHVTLRSQSDAETFALGLRSFVNEARLLARFDHPSLLKVHRFWEANGTAYMAMPVMRGRTVKEIRLEMVSPPDEAWLRALLDPLLGAIEKLHSEGVYHRDIAPDNIQIEPGGRPVLLDFGAARRVLSDKSQTLTAILKPAYAPIEQYAEAGAVKQGPWTDIYALGATLHFLLLTRPPPPATTRAVHDEASALTPLMLPGCSPAFLNVIDWMLAPRPSDRPQSVAALRDVLEGRAPPPVRRETVPAVSQWDRTVIVAPVAPPPSDMTTLARKAPPAHHDDQATVVMPSSAAPAYSPPAAATTAPAAVAADARTAPARAPAPAPAPPAPPSDTPPAPRAAKSRLVPVGGALAAVLVAVAAVVLWPRGPAPAPVAADPAASAVVAALPTPLPPLPSVPESQVTTVTVPGAAATPAPPAPAAVSPPPVSPQIAPSVAPPPVASSIAPPFAVSPPPDRAADRPAAPPVAAVTPPPAAAVRPPPTAQQRPPASAVRPASPAIATTTPGTTNTTLSLPGGGNAQPEPQRPPVQAAPAAPAPGVETPAAVAAGPEARCGGRNPLSYFICMERECLRSEVAGHADCMKWRRNAKRE